MFGFSLGELLVIATVALLVLGPEDLPKVIRTVVKAWRSVQLMMRDVREQLDEAIGKEELDELRQLRESLKGSHRFIMDQEGKMQRTYDISDLTKKREMLPHDPAPHVIRPDDPAA